MVAILLSTYNGEKYLAEQLSSILVQSYPDFKLYIVDDGSTDNTNKIIDEFIAIDQRVVKLYKEHEHDGPCFSYMWLLNQIDADFYFFVIRMISGCLIKLKKLDACKTIFY